MKPVEDSRPFMVYSFDERRHDFAAMFSNKLGGRLEELHKNYVMPLLSPEYNRTLVEGKEDIPEIQRSAYALMRSPGFQESYQAFLREYVAPLFAEELLFQAVPSAKFHFPGNRGTPEFHRDSDFGHPREEVNIWIPLTRVEPGSTLWIEHEDSHVPVLIETDQFILFHGSIREHGSHISDSNKTRVSIDARVLRVRDCEAVAEGKQSEITGTRFAAGEYYERLR